MVEDMGFISFLVIGVAVAALAKASLPGRLGNGWLPAVGVGLVAGLLGSTLLRLIFGILFSPKILFLALVVGAAVFAWRALKGRRSAKHQPTA